MTDLTMEEIDVMRKMAKINFMGSDWITLCDMALRALSAPAAGSGEPVATVH